MSASGGDGVFYDSGSTFLCAVNLALPYFQLLPILPNNLMNRTIYTTALIATALMMSGCLDPAVRRNRSAYADTRTRFGDREDDRRDRNREAEEEDADEGPGPGEPVAPPPTDVEQPAETKVPPPPMTVSGPVPYAIKAPGKPGFVTSPFAEGKLIDVRGLPPGTEFECPYTKRPIQVP